MVEFVLDSTTDNCCCDEFLRILKLALLLCRKAMQNELAKGVSKQEVLNKAHNTLIAKTTVFSPKALMDKGSSFLSYRERFCNCPS